eukprot:14526979-Ditylum_brightwellii.AAC.1
MGLQRIAEFSGKMEDWNERNNGTQCVINGSGWRKSLSGREYAEKRRNQHRKDSTMITRMDMLQENH